MVYGNPIFSKESFKEATSHIGHAVDDLIYHGNKLYSQENAANELRQARWILVTIIDYIFDYYPYSYFMNKDELKEYSDFLEWFRNHPEVGVRNAIKFVENNFAEIETITRNKSNRHIIFSRDLNKEEHVKKVFVEIQNNLEEIIRLLNGPKKMTDPGKPTADEISMLIRTIEKIQDHYSKMAEERHNVDFSLHVFHTNELFEIYKLPLLKAWEVYYYGLHSDFWKEGDPMWDYMNFEMKAKETIKRLVDNLSQQSPFSSIENNSEITNGLLKVYRHLLTQNLS